MIRKLATIPGLRFLAFLMTVPMGIAVVHAQQPSAQQPPVAQPQTQQQPDQSSSQEASPEETTRPQKKPLDYKKWPFNVGGGASLPNGTTNTYVRGGGGIAAAGVGDPLIAAQKVRAVDQPPDRVELGCAAASDQVRVRPVALAIGELHGP